MQEQHDLAEQLCSLIADSRHNELACRPFLPSIAAHLCHDTVNRLVQIGTEEPNRFGSADFVVSAEISHGGYSQVDAYVWELKAPQLFLYEYDGNLRRYRPSIALIRAETQLLHYVSEFQDSGAFRDYFGLSARSRVVPAGIIIGQRDRLAKIPASLQDNSLEQLVIARYSDSIRRNLFYDPARIRVKTWTWVADTLRAPSKISLR